MYSANKGEILQHGTDIWPNIFRWISNIRYEWRKTRTIVSITLLLNEIKYSLLWTDFMRHWREYSISNPFGLPYFNFVILGFKRKLTFNIIKIIFIIITITPTIITATTIIDYKKEIFANKCQDGIRTERLVPKMYTQKKSIRKRGKQKPFIKGGKCSQQSMSASAVFASWRNSDVTATWDDVQDHPYSVMPATQGLSRSLDPEGNW